MLSGKVKEWSDIYGQTEVIEQLKRYSNVKELPHMIFEGSPGVGKTTSAHLLSKSLRIPLFELNASDERGIDIIRDKVKRLLFSQGERLILLDEADSLTKDAMNSLRRPLETALLNTKSRVIFTVNDISKVIEPILSRCRIFHFKRLSADEIANIIRTNLDTFSGEELQQLVSMIMLEVEGDARKAVMLCEEIRDKSFESAKTTLEYYLYAVDNIKNFHKTLRECDVERGFQLIEDIVSSEVNAVLLLWKELKNDNSLLFVEKVAIYKSLTELENGLKRGGNSLVLWTGFMFAVMEVYYKRWTQ